MSHFDIAIIGTGSGNSILDQRYADKRVAICEQGVFGGTCLNVGCIPTKMFVYAAEVAQNTRESARYGVDAHVDGVRWADIVSRVFGRIDPLAVGGENYRRSSPNVEVFASHTRFRPTKPDGRYALRTDDGDEFTADQVVIAAGSRAVVPDAITECGVPHHTSDTIMRIPDVPGHLIIVGGGFVACEFAHIFSALGSHVTLMIRGSTLLRGHDDDIAMRFTDIASKKWEVHNHHEVIDAHEVGGGVEVKCHDGSTVRGDMLLVATGRRANGDLLDAEHAGVKVTADGQVMVDEYQRTTARGIFALGDVSSDYQLKHVANHEARRVKHNLLQDWDNTEAMMPSDHRYVPSAVFTDPQIASVGLTENEARAKGLNIRVKIQDFGDVAYGWAMEDTTGVAKLIVDDDSGLLLGAHIMGHQASSLIQPLIQAMSFDLPAQDMARGQYWIHPALP
ncbi:MAG: mycothione reductase, partial [Mycobacterium sp.]|nr:mycothione reductase [Mycobacterium sp.]